MSEHGTSPQGALARAVSQTLDSVVAPYVRRAICDDALRAAGRSTLPADLPSLRHFVEGPLRAAAERSLGRALAGSVVEEIQRAIAAAGTRRCTAPQFSRQTTPPPASSTSTRSSKGGRYSSAHPDRLPSSPRKSPIPPLPGLAPLPEASVPRSSSAPPPRSSQPPETEPPATFRSPSPHPAQSHSYFRRPYERIPTPPVTPSDYFRRVALTHSEHAGAKSPSSAPAGARVLVATRDTQLLSTLSSWLGQAAQVNLVRSVFSVLHAVEDFAGQKLVVVLDCEQPSIRPAALAALADDLTDVEVVLFRASADVRRTAIAICPAAKRWVTFESKAPARHVAEHCLELVS